MKSISLNLRMGSSRRSFRKAPSRSGSDFSQNSGVLRSMASSDAGSTGFMQPHLKETVRIEDSKRATCPSPLPAIRPARLPARGPCVTPTAGSSLLEAPAHLVLGLIVSDVVPSRPVGHPLAATYGL